MPNFSRLGIFIDRKNAFLRVLNYNLNSASLVGPKGEGMMYHCSLELVKRQSSVGRTSRALGMFAFATAALLIAFVLSPVAFGQAVSQITGTTRDPSGAAVPDVTVTATQTDTGAKRSVTTDESGSFTLPNLPLGPYRLEAAKTGFRTYVQTGIQLQVGSAPEIPIRLEVGAVAETIDVVANTTQVETRNAGVGTVVETQQILDLPLNGRQATDLITLSGLAVQTDTSPSFNMNTGVKISVAGGLGADVQYNLETAPPI